MSWTEQDYAALVARRQSDASARVAPPRRIHSRPEEQLQRQVVDALRALPLDGFCEWWATPNQRGSRTRAEMGILQAMGVKPGVADLAFVLRGARAAFLELKAPGHERDLSEPQRAFERRVTALGADYRVASSLEQVRVALVQWGVEPAKRWRLEGDE